MDAAVLQAWLSQLLLRYVFYHPGERCFFARLRAISPAMAAAEERAAENMFASAGRAVRKSVRAGVVIISLACLRALSARLHLLLQGYLVYAAAGRKPLPIVAALLLVRVPGGQAALQALVPRRFALKNSSNI